MSWYPIKTRLCERDVKRRKERESRRQTEIAKDKEGDVERQREIEGEKDAEIHKGDT